MENIIMSKKEVDQIGVFEKLKRKEITQIIAAKMLKISDRAVRKKMKRYLAKGAIGLVHQSRSRPSPKRWDEKEKDWAMSLWAGEFEDFGPTFAAEKLQERYGIKTNRETLRQAMIKTGIWIPKKIKPIHRKRRQRRLCFGMMIQLDGSPHDWFEGRGSKCTLLVFIDDATSRIIWLEFSESESFVGVMRATQNYFKAFGRPQSFYVDYGSVFSINTNNPERDKLSQFERAMMEMSVEVIHARSPQAKGRVERANQTLQDRLIKEMRLAGISNMDEANIFVQELYIKKHNELFSVQAAESIDMHRSISGFNMPEIFCKKEERILQNDFIITYNKRIFQLEKQQKTILRPKNRIMVNEHLDGRITLSVRKTVLFFSELVRRPQWSPVVKKAILPKYYKPASNHPWRGTISPSSHRNAKSMAE
jgi:hypothetical protein